MHLRLLFFFSVLVGITARRPVRAQPASPPGFPDLQVTISAHQDVGRPVSVLVQLAYPIQLGARGRCFVASGDLRVEVDGQPLQLTARGGPSRPSEISGIQVPDPLGCTTAQFRSPPGARLAPRRTSVVVIAERDRRAVVRVDRLLRKRTVRVRPARTVRVGERVELRWTDHARWEGNDLSTSVVLYGPHQRAITVPRDQLVVRPPTFSFVVPALRPGRVFVELYTELLLSARILECRGLRSCDARPNPYHDRVELTVAP